MFRRLIVVFGLSAAVSGVARAGQEADAIRAICVSVLDPVARARAVVRALDHLPGETIVQPDRFKSGEGYHIVRSLDVSGSQDLYATGNLIADLGYIMSDSTTMRVELARVEQYRGHGFMKWLLAQALLREPNTKRIESRLQWDNFAAFANVFFELPRLQRVLHPVASVRQAVMTTPAYKARAALGFVKIVSATMRMGEEEIYLVVER